MNGHRMVLVWYKRRNIGASFCQVMRIKAGLRLEFFVIPTNHSWNGEAAIFTRRDSIGIKINNVILNLGDLKTDILSTNKTDATD
jgi:hypothetical protein